MLPVFPPLGYVSLPDLFPPPEGVLVYLTCSVVPANVFLLLGCVSLPNLPCCSNQLPNQKWVQVPCTKTVCSTVLVCQQVFSPLGCVSLPNLPCYSNQPPNQKWVHPTLCERNIRNNLSVSLFVCLSCTLAGGCYYFG